MILHLDERWPDYSIFGGRRFREVRCLAGSKKLRFSRLPVFAAKKYGTLGDHCSISVPLPSYCRRLKADYCSFRSPDCLFFQPE
jgi:hypothetical protein